MCNLPLFQAAFYRRDGEFDGIRSFHILCGKPFCSRNRNDIRRFTETCESGPFRVLDGWFCSRRWRMLGSGMNEGMLAGLCQAPAHDGVRHNSLANAGAIPLRFAKRCRRTITEFLRIWMNEISLLVLLV